MSALREHFAHLRTFAGMGFRKTALLCALSLLIAAVAGWITALVSPDRVELVLDAFQQMVQESGVVDSAGNISVFGLLTNNWRAMLLSVLYGFIPFLFLPAVTLAVNGMLMGVMGGYYHAHGSVALYLAGILPHGVFELTALVLAAACGITLCRNLCFIILGSPAKRPMVELLTDLLRMLLLVILPLTVAAALIECYLTPLVMGLFL